MGVHCFLLGLRCNSWLLTCNTANVFLLLKKECWPASDVIIEIILNSFKFIFKIIMSNFLYFCMEGV